MSRSSWGVVVAALFAIVLQWTPLPAQVRATLILLAWVALALSCIGWLLAHTKRGQQLRSHRKATRPMVLLVVFVVGGCLTVATWLLVPKLIAEQSSSQPPQDADVKNTNSVDVKALNAKLAEIERLLKEQSPDISPSKLLAEYPGGYVIFETTYQNRVFPYANHLAKGWTINWDSVHLATSGDRVEIQLPDMSKPESNFHVHGNRIGLRKIKGATGSGIDLDTVSPYVEILAVSDEGIVFLVGLKPPPPDITDQD